MGRNAKQLASSKFDRDLLAKKLIDVIKKAANA